MMNDLQLHNSLTRQKEIFVPIDPAHIRLYVCGPTVYNYAHIGNARMAVVFDQLSRVLREIYPKVTYVSNITDIDDKIIGAAQDTGEEISVITQRFTKIYNADMASLYAKAPDIQPLATQHIGEMIEIIERLITNGHAYAQDGHVLFHVPSFEKYGGLSGRTREEQIAGARIDVASYKKDPADFVLWKPSTSDQPGWDSPWGFGRPGWHIECSAMAEKHLGLPFDIHGGGADLKFPHHENEIAQSCCAHGHTDDLSQFSKFWVHNGFVTVNGEKMSKSLGNVTLVHDLLDQGIAGAVIRLALLSSHYRQPLDWTQDKIHQAKKLLAKIYNIVGEETHDPLLYAPIFEALKDDLNTPKVLAELNGLIKSDSSDEKKKQYLVWALQILGLPLTMKQNNTLDENKINALIEERTLAKANKDFNRSDAIRDELLKMGVTLKDTRDGTLWTKI